MRCIYAHRRYTNINDFFYLHVCAQVAVQEGEVCLDIQKTIAEVTAQKDAQKQKWSIHIILKENNRITGLWLQLCSKSNCWSGDTTVKTVENEESANLPPVIHRSILLPL